MTARRFVGRLTSANPAAAKMLRLPTWISSQLIFCPRVVQHRVRLERASTATASEGDRSSRERIGDSPASEPGADEDAGHGPDGPVGLVLCPALPGDAVVAHQPAVGGTRLDRAPADGLAVEEGDEAAGRLLISGWPQAVCSCSRWARSSTGNLANASLGRSLYRWHRQ